MYRRSRRHKKFPDLALAILGVVAFVTLGALLYINDKQEKEQQAKYEGNRNSIQHYLNTR